MTAMGWSSHPWLFDVLELSRSIPAMNFHKGSILRQYFGLNPNETLCARVAVQSAIWWAYLAAPEVV